MKRNKKLYYILVLVLVVIMPLNVMAEEAQTPETQTPEVETPVVPETPSEDVTDPIIPTPGEEENTGDNTEKEEIKKEQAPEGDDKNNTNKEETEKEEEIKEEVKEEKVTKEEETKEPVKRPNIDYSTTIIDNGTKRVEISILGKNDELLSGIKFQIQDKNGNIFYEEETTNEVFVFEEMELGTYYLVQLNALDGYSENSEKVEFMVSKDSEIVKVEVKNKLKSEEKPKKQKDVFGMEAPLLCSIAMFDIALCIGIVIYVRKNKTKIKNKK